jgi:hypothetical protein
MAAKRRKRRKKEELRMSLHFLSLLRPATAGRPKCLSPSLRAPEFSGQSRRVDEESKKVAPHLHFVRGNGRRNELLFLRRKGRKACPSLRPFLHSSSFNPIRPPFMPFQRSGSTKDAKKKSVPTLLYIIVISYICGSY